MAENANNKKHPETFLEHLDSWLKKKSEDFLDSDNGCDEAEDIADLNDDDLASVRHNNVCD